MHFPAPSDSPSAILTSGFGAVMKREHDLQSSTEERLGAIHGPHATAIDRILRDQQVRLGANIALLEQRYATLPHPARFHALRKRFAPLTKARRVAAASESIDLLPELVTQHRSLLENLLVLVAQGVDGRRAETNLAAMAGNHEEMAWMLTALLKEDATVRDRVLTPVIAAGPEPVVTIAASPLSAQAEGRWENEGGTPASPPASSPPFQHAA